MQCRLFYCIMENEQRGMITFILAVCGNVDYVYSFPQSPPSRAAWIEIVSRVITTPYAKSLPSRAAWIEMVAVSSLIVRFSSPPSRAAWFEILHTAAASRLRARRRLHGRRGFKFSSTLQKHLTYRSLHSQVVCMQRFACVICLRSESSLIKNRVTAF